MKTNRNFWRVLVLALALVMMFAIVACAKDGDEAAATTEAAGSTAGSTEAETTTAKATTEPKQTTATTEPATTEPATTEPPIQEVPNDANSVAEPSQFGGAYIFSNYLPVKFTSDKVVKVDAANYLETSNGVGTHYVTLADGSKLNHYYVDFEEKDAEKMKDNPNLFVSYEFEVAEDGYYEICYEMRMKDGKQRGNIMLIDDVEVCKLDFQFDDVSAIQDNSVRQTTYMSGMSTALKAGKHTLTMKGVPAILKTFHFRTIFMVKTADLPAETPAA